MNWLNWGRQDWSSWKSEYRSTRRLKHATVKGQPVAGTGKRKRGRHRCSGCDWCIPAMGHTRTERETKAMRLEQEAN